MGDIGRVRSVFSGFTGGPGVSTLFFRVDDSTSWEAQKQPIIDALDDAWYSFAQVIPTEMTIEVQGEIDIIDEEDGELVTTISGTNQDTVGAGTEGFGPIATGVAIEWLTAGVVAGRHVRGRTFVVPLGRDVADENGSPNALVLSSAASFAAAVIAADGGNADLVVWSRPRLQLGTTGKPVVPHVILTPGSAHKVLSATVRDVFCVLRSRRD